MGVQVISINIINIIINHIWATGITKKGKKAAGFSAEAASLAANSFAKILEHKGS